MPKRKGGRDSDSFIKAMAAMSPALVALGRRRIAWQRAVCFWLCELVCGPTHGAQTRAAVRAATTKYTVRRAVEAYRLLLKECDFYD